MIAEGTFRAAMDKYRLALGKSLEVFQGVSGLDPDMDEAPSFDEANLNWSSEDAIPNPTNILRVRKALSISSKTRVFCRELATR